MVDCVYINTYRKDFWFARICIASVRYWYPDIPIQLIKDFGAGDFDTSVAERVFNVGIMDTGGKSFGWGFGKFEPLFQQRRERFLFLDADTIMLGPVLDALPTGTDFVVDLEDLPEEKLHHLYFDPAKVQPYDPGFVFPGHAFNTGQWVGTSGLLQRKDFEPHVQWEPGPKLTEPRVFKQADQGVFNYVLFRQAQRGKLTIVRHPLMLWPAEGRTAQVSLGPIAAHRGDYPLIMHFAGMKGKSVHGFPHQDILQFYQDQYYQAAGAIAKTKDNLLAAVDQGTSLLAAAWRKLSH
jgi:hypothetical protein